MHMSSLSQSAIQKSEFEVQATQPETLVQLQKKTVIEIEGKLYFFTKLWKDYSGHPGDCNCLFCNF